MYDFKHREFIFKQGFATLTCKIRVVMYVKKLRINKIIKKKKTTNP